MKCHSPGWCAAAVWVEQVEKKWLAEEKEQVYNQNQVFLHTNRGVVCCSFVLLVYLLERKDWPCISMAWYKTTTCYFHQQGHDPISFFTGSTSFPAPLAMNFPVLSFWVSPHASKSLHASGGYVSALAAAAFSDRLRAEADKSVVLSPTLKVHPPLQKHPGCIASKCKSHSCPAGAVQQPLPGVRDCSSEQCSAQITELWATSMQPQIGVFSSLPDFS